MKNILLYSKLTIRLISKWKNIYYYIVNTQLDEFLNEKNIYYYIVNTQLDKFLNKKIYIII